MGLNDLLNNLEFAGIYDFSAPVPKLVNIYAPEEIGERNVDPGGNCFKIENFFTYEIKNLERIKFIEALLKFKVDSTNGRVGKKTHKLHGWLWTTRYNFILGEATQTK